MHSCARRLVAADRRPREPAKDWRRALRCHAECQAPGGRRERRRPDRRSGKGPRSIVTIMASCVPCLFRKTDDRRGSGLPCRDPARSGFAVSLQVRVVWPVMARTGQGKTGGAADRYLQQPG
jgi:hypothetical protein